MSEQSTGLPAGIEKDSQQHVDWLMIPRYLIIAPDTSGKLIVGDIIQFTHKEEKSGQWYNILKKTDRIYDAYYDNFPHLFHRMAWWEQRTQEQMPGYVKQTEIEDSFGNKIPDRHLKVKKHFNAGNGEWRDNSFELFCTDDLRFPFGTSLNYSHYQPATRDEWEAQQSQFNQN